MERNATEIMNDFFNRKPNGHIYFGWGSWNIIDIYKNDNNIIFDVEIRGFCWSDGHTLFNYNDPKELARLKSILFVKYRDDPWKVYYGDQFEGLNDKNFVEALEKYTKN